MNNDVIGGDGLSSGIQQKKGNPSMSTNIGTIFKGKISFFPRIIIKTVRAWLTHIPTLIVGKPACINA